MVVTKFCGGSKCEIVHHVCCIAAPGETVTIAEEMAARDALRRFFNITDRRAPLPFGQVGHKLQLADSEQQ